MTVEEYLAQLRVSLRGADKEVILAEAEDHLHETVTAGLAAGLSRREAEDAAISAFGSVRAVVRAHHTRRGKLAVATDAVLAAWKLGSAALIAVGLSGLVADVLNHAFGPAFVGRARAGASYPQADCQYWLSAWHQAHTCAVAAMLESSTDAVSLRLAAGAFGVVLLGAYGLTRLAMRWTAERHPRVPDPALLSRDWFPTFAALGSGGAALLMTGLMATHTYIGLPAGPGFYVSGIVAALAVCAGSTMFAIRRFRHVLT